MMRSRPFAGIRRTSGRMEPLEQLRAKITNFPGYGGDAERRLSDEYVRSYLGEALANMPARDALPPELQQRLDDLIVRTAFADPRLFPERRRLSNAVDSEEALAGADLDTVEVADRAKSVDASSAAAYLDRVTACLDARDAAMRAQVARAASV